MDKILSKFIHFSEDIEEEHIFTSIKGHNSVVYKKFSPFAIPNHSSLISISMQKVKKIGQKLLKSESRNKALTDGRTLNWFGGYNTIIRHFSVAGYKNDSVCFIRCWCCKMILHLNFWVLSWQNQRVWPEPSLCAQCVAKDPNFLHAGSKDSDQTGRMPRLIWAFAGCTCHFVGFVTRRLIWQRSALLQQNVRFFNFFPPPPVY